MKKRLIHDPKGHAHFITFSWYKRRRLLDEPRTRHIVVSVLASQLLKQNGNCLGFVIMPDHVHALVRFPEQGQLSFFMKQWKQRSSVHIKRVLKQIQTRYIEKINLNDPVWQRHYHSLNVFSEEKLIEKLKYMHNNPVGAGLANTPCAWPDSSARYYEQGKSVGVAIG
ncbi:MAG: transposase [Deltaproteobacteria bacterium]|nr:transposase [Deltaproteobacteria bacterium]MBW2087311.1 transposase [Deltaproteobacteria bacterium]